MKRTFALALVATLALSLPVFSTSASASVKPGTACKQLNQMKTDSGLNYICVQKGKKLTWANLTVHYEQTKLKAYSQIRAGADSGNLDNVTLVYHASSSFPKDLKKLYTSQVEYASKLYGSFFSKKEVMNIYMYTEKDEKLLKPHKILGRYLEEHIPWFEAWRQGRDQEHNLGLAAWYLETTPGVYEGHAGVLVSSEANAKSLRKYAIQVMPHEYWHVVQDYFFRSNFDALYQKRADKKMDGQDFYSMYFPTTFREGSANTISFALASNTKKEYLDLYRDFIQEKKRQTDVKIFATLTSTAAVESALKKIEDKRKFSEAHEASYSLGSLLYEWLIAEYGFDAYKKIIENQMIGSKFEDNIKASLGMPVSELYKKAAPHILAAFNSR
ncbi:hypothetical protein MCEMRE185_00489 [Candidatus Nanopelagicaceae bacterium]